MDLVGRARDVTSSRDQIANPKQTLTARVRALNNLKDRRKVAVELFRDGTFQEGGHGRFRDEVHDRLSELLPILARLSATCLSAVNVG